MWSSLVTALARPILPFGVSMARLASKDMKKKAIFSSASPLIWIDCEITGLDIEKSRLVEIACIVTDAKLKTVAEFGPVVIHQPPQIMENMDDWCKATFKENGLTKRIEESVISEKEAENQVLNFLHEHTKPSECPLAGNTVYMDKLFLMKYMPRLVEHLHYRIVDVSTIKELVSRWYSKESIENVPKKKMKHLALDDIRESIEELRYYRENFFR